MKRLIFSIIVFMLLSSNLVFKNQVFSESNEISGYSVIDVPYISQLYPHRAVVGCEPAALLMGLKYKGVATDVSLENFLAAMPKTSTDPAKGFAGSPYTPSEKIRTTIYPKPLSDYANTYMDGITRDISGCELDTIKMELLNGNPVLIYATMWWNKPYYRQFNIEGEKQWLLRNNHAVLLTGYDSENQKFYVADPYNKSAPKKSYFYWINESKLKPIYDERKWAIAVGETAPTPVPNSLEDIKPEDFIDVLINNNPYKGVLFEEIVYVDLALVLEKELNSIYSYDPNLMNATVRFDGKFFTISLINGSIYDDKNSFTGRISDKKLVIDGKTYIDKQDIDTLLELLKQ